eukprot:TRINITY_DN75169_c0_g1_i1.p1 TRINITY_DN75169_c0_g1~~TRINITY_DN75169_c0_g1_i1.p1  ORF type:complete len:291 (+),score=129.49 TRINITY_DN75169_c0_g1_i1:3-875(+)
MMMTVIRWLAIAVVAVAVVCGDVEAAGGKTVMPWMCLQRCGRTEKQIKASLASFKERRDLVSAVSFEMYNLGADGALVLNSDLYPVVGPLTQMGVQTFPMVSSYPYPPQFLDWMRALWTNQEVGDRFIDQLVTQAKQYQHSGYNIDWEPTSRNATLEDAQQYAAFLDRMAQQLKQRANLRVTVDISSWSNIWHNWTALADTAVDRVITMSTYTNNFTTFSTNVKRGVDQIGVDKLGVGLASYNLATNQSFSLAEVKERFALIAQLDVQEVDIWRAPIPAAFWYAIKHWLS